MVKVGGIEVAMKAGEGKTTLCESDTAPAADKQAAEWRCGLRRDKSEQRVAEGMQIMLRELPQAAVRSCEPAIILHGPTFSQRRTVVSA